MAIFQPSYTHLPDHYRALIGYIHENKHTGRANLQNEKIFIAITLYDRGGRLASGPWAENILDLIDLLGPENTFLSIYENDGGKEAAEALRAFGERVRCQKELVYEDLSPSRCPTVTMPDGRKRVKRLVYLSKLRNLTLRALSRPGARTYDRVLFLNDVYFDPVDAVQLLFSTNIRADGKADYAVACALDFHRNTIKMYDLYATRDLEGFSMGVPFYPFFSHAGKAQSRNDILAQKDAVRVKSCWSGMAAFDARYLQASTRIESSSNLTIGDFNIDPAHPSQILGPVRFRAEPEIFFDACECCLLVADIIKLHRGTTNVSEDSGVYINPYIRVGYSRHVHWWTWFSRRFERLYVWPHYLVDAIARMPTYNRHQYVQEGERFQEEVWIEQPGAPGGGRWEIRERIARNGLYCGVREMQVLLESRRTGDKNWESINVPQGRTIF